MPNKFLKKIWWNTLASGPVMLMKSCIKEKSKTEASIHRIPFLFCVINDPPFFKFNSTTIIQYKFLKSNTKNTWGRKCVCFWFSFPKYGVEKKVFWIVFCHNSMKIAVLKRYWQKRVAFLKFVKYNQIV